MTQIGSGVLKPGEIDVFEAELRGGTTYATYVEPSDPSVDFDLRIYVENGNLIDQDTTIESDVLCFVRPRWTGPSELRINSARGKSSYYIRIDEAG